MKPFVAPPVGAVIATDCSQTSVGRTKENSRSRRSHAIRPESAEETACRRGPCSASAAVGLEFTCGFGAGGSASLTGLADELQRLIGVRVRVGDPLARLKLPKKLAVEQQVGSLAVAIGLGIED